MKYQYTSKGYLNSLNSNDYSGVKLLLIGNIAIFILMEFLLISNNYIHDKLFYNLALVPNHVYNHLYIWQCITYLFLHGGIIHLLFNMLGLWFLGIDLESLWGKQKFLKYYFLTGIGSALITIIYNVGLSNPFIPIVGGLGYEVLKLTAKYRNNIFFLILAKPGLWLQNITTKQPDDSQVEVALKALEEAFGNKLPQYTHGDTYVAEAIG